MGLGFEIVGVLAVLGLTLVLWMGGSRKSCVRKAVGFLFFSFAALVLWDCSEQLKHAWAYCDYEAVVPALIMAGVPAAVGLWLLLERQAAPCVVCGEPAWVGLRLHEGSVCNEKCLYRYLSDAPDEALRVRRTQLEANLHRVSTILGAGAVCTVLGLALTPFTNEYDVGPLAGLLGLGGLLLLCLVVPLKRLVLLRHAARVRTAVRSSSAA